MDTSLFDYVLPGERIAQSSVEPRDHARLLVLDRADAPFTDQHMFDLPSWIHSGDLLVFNDSKVFRARLQAKQRRHDRSFEIFLLHPQEDLWVCLARPMRYLLPGDELVFAEGVIARVIDKDPQEGTMRLRFALSAQEVFAFTDRVGDVPTPPYVDATKAVSDSYQTVYAKHVGSVAAPTAGFHFTEELLARLEAAGVERTFVTLHVGLGTFRPMKSDCLEEHRMHEEWANVSPETVQRIQDTKKRGGRVIAVGTTAVRALESAAATGELRPFSDYTRLFITPGYTFRVIDGLLTNFHLPKSTLLVLVSTFAGIERIKHAYQHAIEQAYRFYSFGDAMLIL